MSQQALRVWRQEGIRRMAASRRATLSLLARMPERDLLRRRTQGRWSVKDVLAHIAAWEAEGVHRLRLIAKGRGHRIHFYEDMREVDRFNARAVAAARPMSLAALLRRAADVRRRLVAELRRLPAHALRDRSHEVPVVGWLPAFAWTHERGHLREIKAWWRRRGRGSRAP